MKNPKPYKITDFLSVGAENAISCETLSKIFGCNSREITICINALRRSGTIICSGGSGFWLPENDEDIRRFVKQIHHRVAEIQKAIKPAEDYLKSASNTPTNEVVING